MWRVLAVNALILAGLVILAEGALARLVAVDEPTGIHRLDRLARDLYWANVSYVQFDPDCARYDPELAYTLRPGACTFANTGFSIGLSVNSAGLRDDEASLDAPRIVVLGDSQAMGWGVDQEQTFAKLIEAETGHKTLNAGISSYGTARELLMLRRLDLRGVHTVILQYSDNDARENRSYLAEGRLDPMPEAEYAAVVAGNRAAGGGFGSYLPAWVRLAMEETAPPGETESRNRPVQELGDEEVFVEVLAGWDWGNDPPHLVMFDVNVGGRGGKFMRAVSEAPGLAALRSKLSDLTILFTPEILEPDDYLFPDGHLSPEGHRKLAAAVVTVLHSKGH
jgi:hypothetical protein